MSNIQLGLGLIGIGRVWGHANAVVPSEKDALNLLAFAHRLGIRYFDTAPSYGSSEERLGFFLNTLSDAEREKLTIATKFGEYWNKKTHEAFTDHSFIGLKKGLEDSIKRLKKIDVLYLHKTTIESLKSEEVAKGFLYAKALGIKKFGASVSDRESAEFICNSDFYTIIQFPYNLGNRKFADIIELAKQKNKTVVINRPFGMGDLLYSDEYKELTPEDLKRKAYEFILQKNFNGVVLTGTKSQDHLMNNYKLFLNSS